MAHQVPWCQAILEEFIEKACLTPEEEKIMRTRVAGWSISKQAIELGMSESTVNRIVHKLKLKYDNCQKYSEILPERKKSAAETWMDTH